METSIAENLTHLHYPQAAALIESAQECRSRMTRAWNEQVDSGLVQESVVIHHDGTGSMSGFAAWTPGARQTITAQLEDCVRLLWDALDSLVAETVAAFSVLRRPRAPDKKRFFPIADSWKSFDALLAESALDGVLKPHHQMIRDCQPFNDHGADEYVNKYRTALHWLLTWSTALDEGQLVVAWATPVSPEVEAAAPTLVKAVKKHEPGPVNPDRVFASFQLTGHTTSSNVAGRSGTYVDLSFGTDFQPSDRDDLFSSRLDTAIETVATLAAYFAWHTHRVAGSRSLPASTWSINTVNWTRVTESKRYWSGAELQALEQSDLGLGVVTESDELTFIIATPEGVFERTIPHASPLNHYVSRGVAAETAARDAAATWGLPDFVLRPRVERKGAGVREISDGLVLVGARGLIVQSKAREAAGNEPSREANWLNKQIKKASAQIDGTARRLLNGTSSFMNGRGHLVAVDSRTIEWLGIVILDHPDSPADFTPAPVPSRVSFAILLRRDWEFLFDQLRSTSAVVDYLFRIEKTPEILGSEPLRYFELARADRDAAPDPMDPVIERLGTRVHVPLLPTAPAGTEDPDGFGLFRMILEDIANTSISDEKVQDRLDVLASLDKIPVMHRADLGRLLLTELRAHRDGAIRWKSRIFLAGSTTDQVGFAVCSQLNEITKNGFRAWALLRHHDRGGRVGSFDGLRSISVLLTPRTDGYRDWDTTMFAVSENPQLTPDEIASWRKLWGPQADADAE